MGKTLRKLAEIVTAALKKPGTVMYLSFAVIAAVAIVAAFTIYFSDARVAMPILVVAPGAGRLLGRVS